jgi:hypothetical protein
MSRQVTVGDLIESLENYGRDVEVRIMHQPSYPLQEVIGGVYDASGAEECAECELPRDAEDHDRKSDDFSHDFENVSGSDANVVYIVADGHPSKGSPYGDRRAWEAMERV